MELRRLERAASLAQISGTEGTYAYWAPEMVATAAALSSSADAQPSRASLAASASLSLAAPRTAAISANVTPPTKYTSVTFTLIFFYFSSAKPWPPAA